MQASLIIHSPEFQEMPFNGTRFFEAVGMFDDATALKYLRAIWFYWQHTHTNGIPDDDAGLRELCKCDLTTWQRVRGMIFDNDHFFKLENGKWHQARAKRCYEICKERFEKNAAKTLPAREAVARTRKVTEIVTDNEWLESLRANKAYAGIDIGAELGKMAAWCEVRRKNPSRRRFVNWLNNAEKPLAIKSTSTAGLSGVDKMMLNDEYKRVVERMKTLRATYSDHQTWDVADKAEFHKLKNRRDEIKTKLGMTL